MLKFIIKKLFWGGFHKLLTDKQYIKVRNWIENGYWPNLDNPARFTEKIHYLKLYDRSPLRKLAANRLKVREYVANKIGEEYLVPLIGHYDTLTKEIWSSLPEQFVLKASHGSQMVKMVFDKQQENYDEIKKLTDKWMALDYSKTGREWVYENIPREIIAEQLISDKEGSFASDYKLYCFHGSVELIMYIKGRFENIERNFFEVNLKPVDVRLRKDRIVSDNKLSENMDEAVKIAEKLSEDFNFIRVDLYLIKNKIYFGELTNFPGNGFNKMEPDKYEFKYGEMLSLEGIQ